MEGGGETVWGSPAKRRCLRKHPWPSTAAQLIARCRTVHLAGGAKPHTAAQLCFRAEDGAAYRVVDDDPPTYTTPRGRVFRCHAAERARDLDREDFDDAAPAVGYAVCFGESCGPASRAALPLTCWYRDNPVFFRILSLKLGGSEARRPSFSDLPAPLCLIRGPRDLSWLNILAIVGSSMGRGPTNFLQNVIRAPTGRTFVRRDRSGQGEGEGEGEPEPEGSRLIRTQWDLERFLDAASRDYADRCVRDALSRALGEAGEERRGRGGKAVPGVSGEGGPCGPGLGVVRMRIRASPRGNP